MNWKYWNLKRKTVKGLRKLYREGRLITPVMNRWRQSFYINAEFCGVGLNQSSLDWVTEIQARVKK